MACFFLCRFVVFPPCHGALSQEDYRGVVAPRQPSRFTLQFFGCHLRVRTVQSAMPRPDAAVSGRPTQSCSLPAHGTDQGGFLSMFRR
jgi:hypothetical protein